jgi:hypothetical protein
MKSCRKHLESLLFRRHPGQHGDVHTVANYNKLPSELHKTAVRRRYNNKKLKTHWVLGGHSELARG